MGRTPCPDHSAIDQPGVSLRSNPATLDDGLPATSPEEASHWQSAGECIAASSVESAEVAPLREGAVAWRRTDLARRDLVLAVVFAVAALLVRWPFILRGDTLLHSDEAVVGVMAQDIAAGRRFPIYFYGQRYMGALEAYVIAALRPLFDAPIISLRLGPTCFFAALVAVQYLMLTRWFGRLGGWVGATTLLAASPMFLQWSISARGGYIEILLWGSLLWWAYSEWFVGNPARPRPLKQAILGALVGSGLWLNPTIAVFVAPMLVHALLDRPLAAARQAPKLARVLRFTDRISLGLPLALPLLVLLCVIVISSIWSVRVVDSGVEYAVLMDLLPRPVALLAIAAIAVVVAAYVVSQRLFSRLLERLGKAAPLLFGILLGSLPSSFYVLQRTLARQPLEDCLPLGLRPIWTLGENLVYLLRGLPVLLGADPRPFLQLICVGRAYDLLPLPMKVQVALAMLNVVVLVAVIAAGMVLYRQYGREIAAALRLQAGQYSPGVFLVLALSGLVGLYLVSGCTVDFNSIRYLVPLWAVVPGLLAAVAASCHYRYARWVSVGCLLLGWGLGQISFYAELGRPHSLRRLAKSLEGHGVGFALAELFDSHLLSFLTEQKSRIGEYDPFWSRLEHYRSSDPLSSPISYVVHAVDIDWTKDWSDAGWPGPAPPETDRLLWPRLKRTLAERPEEVLSRELLIDGYELWTLAHPLPEPTRAGR